MSNMYNIYYYSLFIKPKIRNVPSERNGMSGFLMTVNAPMWWWTCRGSKQATNMAAKMKMFDDIGNPGLQ